MAISIKKIRALLNISLDDLALILGLTRGRVHHFESGLSFESGPARDKLNLLSRLVREAQKSEEKNTWINHEDLSNEATAWLKTERHRAATTADELTYQLQEMKSAYSSYIKALDILAGIQQDPECPASMKKWVNAIAPGIITRALKSSPMVQAKLQLRRDEAKGRTGK